MVDSFKRLVAIVITSLVIILSFSPVISHANEVIPSVVSDVEVTEDVVEEVIGEDEAFNKISEKLISEFKLTRLEIKDGKLYIKWNRFSDNNVITRIKITNDFGYSRTIGVGGDNVGYTLYDIDCTYNVFVSFKHKDYDKVIDYGTFTIENHDHDSSENIIKSTFTEHGIREYSCSNGCDYRRYETLPLVNRDISIKGLSDFEWANISWSEVSGVDGYEVWVKSGGSYSKYKIMKSTALKVAVTASKKYYKVRSYINKDGNIQYGSFSKEICLYRSDLKLSLADKKLNGQKYQYRSYKRTKLMWNNVTGAVNYKVYKYDSSTKKYKYVCTKNSKTTSCIINNLNPSKTYYFKVYAYDKKGQGIPSNSLKVVTTGKSTGYFYEKVVWDNTWSNILITHEKASNSKINSYRVSGYKPLVKYNYATTEKTLYIHLYTKFVGSGADKKFEYYKIGKNGKYYKSKTGSKTYKTLTKEGLKKYWSVKVKGNSYNFIKGCDFKTKVILHDYSSKNKDQMYTTINIGVDGCKVEGTNEYWFFASSGYDKYYYNYPMNVYMSTNNQLIKNKNVLRGPKISMEAYRSTAAHEVGHNLGLDDAYSTVINGKTVYRITENAETGYYKDKKYHNIMYNYYSYAVANDIEMILQAQGWACIGKANSFQYYRSYKEKGYTFKKSPVIRKK